MTRYTYILECVDGSLYTGSTTDLERRVIEHNTHAKGAKYTQSRRPVTLVRSSSYETRSQATKKERYIKQLNKTEKLKIINSICL